MRLSILLDCHVETVLARCSLWSSIHVCSNLGWNQTICPWWSNVWRMQWDAMWRQVCPILLWQRHMPAVLLQTMLGCHSHHSWPSEPQATGERRKWSPTGPHVPLLISMRGHLMFKSIYHVFSIIAAYFRRTISKSTMSDIFNYFVYGSFFIGLIIWFYLFYFRCCSSEHVCIAVSLPRMECAHYFF